MSVATLSRELEKFSFDDQEQEQEEAAYAPRNPFVAKNPYGVVLFDARQTLKQYVEIIEQPITKKFRYPSEPRGAGPIIGIRTNNDHKTFPTIKIHNYTGKILIVVSCVTKNSPYKPHPHKLISKENCENGAVIINTRITKDDNEYQFTRLGIQCVKKLDVCKSLSARKAKKIDPFKTGYEHMDKPQSIDLKAVRLCFEVFIHDPSHCEKVNGVWKYGVRALEPVVSNVIYNDKTNGELFIGMASDCSGSAHGGKQIILLCEKVTKEDIVEFYLKKNNEVVWTEPAETVLVHKQTAIVFKTPAFKDPCTNKRVAVKFHLKRPKDNTRSNSMPFEYFPDDSRRKIVSEQKIKQEPEDKMVTHILKLYENVDSPCPFGGNVQDYTPVLDPTSSPLLSYESSSPSYAQQPSVNSSMQYSPMLPATPGESLSDYHDMSPLEPFSSTMQHSNSQHNFPILQQNTNTQLPTGRPPQDMPFTMDPLSTQHTELRSQYLHHSNHHSNYFSTQTMQSIQGQQQPSVPQWPLEPNVQDYTASPGPSTSSFQQNPFVDRYNNEWASATQNMANNVQQSLNLQQYNDNNCNFYPVPAVQSEHAEQLPAYTAEDMDTSSLSGLIANCTPDSIELMLTSEEFAKIESVLQTVKHETDAAYTQKSNKE